MLSSLFSRPRGRKAKKTRQPSRRPQLFVERLERRDLLTAFAPGDLIVLQAGDSNQYNTQAPLYLNEYTTTVGGAIVQQAAISATGTVGGTGNQPITIDLTAAAGNGQLNRTYDGAGLVFGGVDSTVNNGGYTLPQTPTGSANRVIAVVGNDPAASNFANVTTYGPFYVGDDNRGGVAESLTGPVYSFGHPNQAGGAVSQGVLYFPGPNGDGSLQPPGTAGIGSQAGVQVSSETNIRGGFIGFDNRLYWTTAGATSLGTAGIYTSTVQPLPTGNSPGLDQPVVKALFSASKVGGMYFADVNGTGVLQNGDRIYLLDDGTVGGAGTGGLYMAIYDTTRWGGGNAVPGQAPGWSPMVRIAEGVIDAQPTPQPTAQLRGLAGTVLSDGSVKLYASEFDNVAGNNSYILGWNDNSFGVSRIASASEAGTTVTITLTDALPAALRGTTTWLSVNSVGTGPATTGGYNGVWNATVSADGLSFTYTASASGLATVTGSGMVGQWLNTGSVGGSSDPYPTPASSQIIQTFADGTLTASASHAQEALRGVAFAPVAATTLSNFLVNGASSVTVSPGTNVTFTIHAANPEAGVTLTGLKVSFIDLTTNTVIGTGTIDGSGNVSFTTTTALVGNHTVSAYFAGGGAQALASAKSSTTVTVNEAGSTASSTSLAATIGGAAATQAAIGRTVTLTATVTGAGATGTVSFYNGTATPANLIGSAPVSSGSAVLNTSFSTAGTVNIIAVYNGDATFASSTSGTVSLTIGNNATAVITTSANNTAVGATPTYTATLTGPLGTVAGTVQFFIDGTALGTPQTLNGSGVATITSTALTAGSHLITISFTPTATSPYNNFAVTTSTSASGVALIETARQPLTPGNLLAVQRGDGSVNLGSSGYLVFLDEYRPNGTLVQRIALPNADAGTTHALLLSGQNGAEGLIQKSGNGQFLTIVGYDVPVGQQFVTSTQPYQFARTIARIDANGNVDTSTAISTSQSAITAATWSGGTATITANNNLVVGDPVTISGMTSAGAGNYNGTFTVVSATATSFTYALATDPGAVSVFGTATGPSVPFNPEDVVTNDGNQFWIASSLGTGDTTDNGILYATLGASTAKQIGPASRAAAAVNIYGTGANAQLAVVNRNAGELGSPLGLANVGTGLPTTGGQTLTGFPNLETEYEAVFPSNRQPEQFVFLNTNDGSSNNPNLAYVADQANGLLKFWKDGSGNWHLGQLSTHNFGQKLLFSGGVTGVVATMINPGTPQAKVNIYVTGSNVQQANPNQIAFFQDQNGAPAGTAGTGVDQGFNSGNFSTTAFVGGAQGTAPPSSPNGNMNFAGLAFVPGFVQGNLVVTQVGTGSGALNGNATATFIDQFTNTGLAQGSIALPTTTVQVTPTALSWSAGTVTVSAANSFAAGASVLIAGASPSGFNGDFAIVSATSSSFTYALPTNPVTTTVTGATATDGASQVSITGAVWASGTVTITANQSFLVGDSVTIAGVSPTGFNGTFTIVSANSTSFTYSLAASPYVATTKGTATAATNSLTEGGAATGEGYLTDSADGQTLSITGYNQIVGQSTGTGPRVVGVVNAAGVVDTTTQFPQQTGSTRVAISADGLGFWVATSTGVTYVPFGNSITTTATKVTNEVGSPTAVGINNGTLWASAGAGAQSSGVPALDSPFIVSGSNPLPTNGGQAIVNPSPTFPTARDAFNNFPSTNQFWVSPDGNTILIADSRTDSAGGLLEYFQSVPNSWVLLGSLQLNSVGVSSTSEPSTSATITAASWASGVVTITANNTFFAGENVTITGMTPAGYNGTFAITSANSTSFTYALATNPGTATAFGTATVNTSVTVTTSAAHGFSVGQTVTISGVSVGGYNQGSVTITSVADATHFTYNLASAGLAAGSGGFATSTDGGLRALAFDPSSNTVYATTTATSGNRLVKITGVTTNGSTPSLAFTVLSTAAANTAYRGVAFSPTNPGTTASATTLAVTNNPASYGTGATLTATVTSGATGYVSFRNSATGAEIGAAPVVTSGGVSTATLVTAGNLFASGTAYSVVATYTGDATFAPSTSTSQSVTINKANTTTTLTVSPNPVATGVNDTLTATISVPVGTLPGGTVTFFDGGVQIGTTTPSVTQVISNDVISFTATLTTTFTTVATHSITATYSGDTNFNGSSSSAVNLVVVNPTTTVVTTSNANPTANPSSSVTLTATVTSTGAGTITGAVQFYDDLSPIGTNSAILSASEVGNTVTITTSGSLVTANGQLVTIYDAQGYNGTYVASNVSGNSFSYTSPLTSLPTLSSGLAILPSVLNGSAQATVTVSTALLQAANSLTPGLHSISAVYTPDAASANTFFTSTGVYEQTVQAQPFGATDQFVYRTGDGTTPLIAQPPNAIANNGAIGSTVYIDEYTAGGTLVQSIILPSADGTGAQNTIHAVVGNGQQSATGQLSLSGDGQFLFAVGYDAAPLAAATAPSVTANTVPRSIARIKYDGTIQTEAFTAGSTGVETAGNLNGVWSPDGNQFYLGGAGSSSGSNGVVYFSSFAPSATLQNPTAVITGNPGFTEVGLEGVGGNLYTVGASSNLVQKYTGFPTASATAAGLPGVTTTTDPNQTFVIDAYFTHENGTGAPAGINTMYLTDDGPGFANGHITKWALNSAGTTWNLVDTLTAGTGNTAVSFYWLSGLTDKNGNVTLDVTYGQGGNSPATSSVFGALYQVSDANGYNAPIGTGGVHSDAVATLASVTGATSLQEWRGVSAAPLPAVAAVVTNGATDAFTIVAANEAVPVPISTATEAGNTVTITTTAANGFVTGESVTIAGVGVAGYNGTFTITVTGATTFTYTDGTAGLANSGGGTAAGATTATITTQAPNDFAVGQQVMVTGVGVAGYNGTFTLTAASGNTFTYTAAAGLTPSSGGQADALSWTISGATLSGATITVTTTAPNGFYTGELVTVSGSGVSGYNGVFNITVTSPTTFTYNTTSSAGALGDTTFNITSATEGGGSGTTVTITTQGATGFTTGQSVTIAGVGVAGYNGAFTITGVSGNTFTYEDPATGLANSSGGTAAVSSTGGTATASLAGAQRSMVDSIVYKFNRAVTLGAGAFTLNAHGTAAISSATEAGTTVTITTAANHGFVTGQVVTIAGVGVAGYNGTFTITVTSPTTFTYTDATSGLANSSGGTAGVGQAPTVNYVTTDGGFTWIITFGGASVVGNSIADGAYDLVLNQAAVTFNTSGATLTQSNRTSDTFYRLYGDTVGHRTVNTTDSFKLKNAFGKTNGQAGYLAFLDYNDTGTINTTDSFQFKKRFGVTLGGFTPTI